ncbi:MAG: hypothetical protein ACJ79H_14810, partial [Myxococcales bacterium]
HAAPFVSVGVASIAFRYDVPVSQGTHLPTDYGPVLTVKIPLVHIAALLGYLIYSHGYTIQ